MPSPETNLCPPGCCPSPFFNSPSASQGAIGRARNSCAACRHSFATATVSSIFPNTQFTNHESLPSLQDSFSEFIKVYPQYSETEQVDLFRAREYSHLSASNHTCLDYIGIALFSYSQLQLLDVTKTQDASSISKGPQELDSYSPLFSISPRTGNIKTLLLHGGQVSEFESAMKKRITSFLNISDDDYFMLFTASRTAAFKLVAECYPFKASRKLLTVYDHESEAVETMISSSEKRGAKVMSAEFKWPRLRIQSAKLRKMIVRRRKNKKKRGLFVLPIHSRVTGARYPYLWMNIAQENGWHVLVDACALGPKEMDSFGLSLFRPDFIICPFYKVFGENPSGFGCLFVKKSVASILENSSSAGIVDLVPERQPFQVSEDSSGTDIELEKKSSRLREELASSSSFFGQKQKLQESSGLQRTEDPAALKAPKSSSSEKIHRTFEDLQERRSKDGEDKNLDIECRCLDQVDSLGLILITNRGRYLINWLVSSLLKLKHPNTEGVPLIKIYGPKIKFDRGPALAFNVFDWKGEKVEPVLVQKLADRSNISLSCGFLHHIWFADRFAGEKEIVHNTKKHGGQGGKKNHKDNLGITVVTAALGFLANFEDMHKLWAFVARFLDADFVEKERWRYTALNQKTIEI